MSRAWLWTPLHHPGEGQDHRLLRLRHLRRQCLAMVFRLLAENLPHLSSRPAHCLACHTVGLSDGVQPYLFHGCGVTLHEKQLPRLHSTVRWQTLQHVPLVPLFHTLVQSLSRIPLSSLVVLKVILLLISEEVIFRKYNK